MNKRTTDHYVSLADKARVELETAGRKWHDIAKHPGVYDECNEKTCYHTHRLVAS